MSYLFNYSYYPHPAPKKTVVLLNGFLWPASVWDAWVSAFKKDSDIFVISFLPDDAGTVVEAAFDGSNHFSAYITALKKILPKDCVVIGWSMGGLVAQALANTEPSYVHKLFLLASDDGLVNDSWGIKPDAFADFKELLLSDINAAQDYFFSLCTHPYSKKLRVLKPPKISVSHAIIKQQLVLLASTLEPIRDNPTVYIFAEHDALISPYKGYCIKEASHCFPFTHTEETLAIIFSYLDEKNSLDIEQRFSKYAQHYEKNASLQAGIADHLLSLKNLQGNLLDLGCGPGREAKIVAKNQHNHVYALDLSVAMLAHINTNSHANIHPIQGHFIKLPFDDDFFDGIWSSFALQWSSSLKKSLAEVYRVLKPNQYFLLSVPGLHSLESLKKYTQLSVHHFMPHQYWKDVAEEVGFCVELFEHKNYSEFYATPLALLKQLKMMGVGSSARANHVYSHAWLQQQLQGLEQAREEQGIPLNYDTYFFIFKKPL
jgi:malonyl-CoA O-methyltransferase